MSNDKNLQKQGIIQGVNVAQQLYYELTPRRAAILDLIAWCEGTDKEIGGFRQGYDILFSYKKFKPGLDHPRVHLKFGNTTTTAAGRYQILDKTWDWIQRHLKQSGFKPFPSFNANYQDQAALYLIDAKRHSLDLVDAGHLDMFLDNCSWEWASLPCISGGGRYNQPIIKPQKCKAVYEQLLDCWESVFDSK